MSKSLIFKISLDIRLSAYILTKNDSFASIILGFLEVFSTFSLENTSKWLLLTLETFTKDTILLSLSTTLKRFPLDMTVLFAKFTPSQLISCTFCKIILKPLVIKVFSPDTGKHGHEETPYLDTFHAVFIFSYILDASIHRNFKINVKNLCL